MLLDFDFVLLDLRLEGIPVEMEMKELGRVSSDDNYRVRVHVKRLQREHIFMNYNRPTRE